MFFLIAFVTVPFTGVLVRYRLAYCPKGAPATAGDLEAIPEPRIASDAENELAAVPNKNMSTGDVLSIDAASRSTDACGQTEIGSGGAVSAAPVETVITKPTFFRVAKRIYQIEGRSGFYKGIIPTIITSFVMWINARNYLTRLYISPAPSTLTRTLTQSLVGTLFYSFALVWIYRSIATRTKLEVFGTSIKDGIRALFTHFERARPYRIVTPSLLSALLGQILLQRFIFHPLEQMTLIEPDQITNHTDAIYFLRLSACFKLVLLLVNTLICAPLDVIVTRLVVQHNYGGSHITTEEPLGTDTAVLQAKVDEKSTPSTREPELNDNLAVRYRGDDLKLYTSVYDCAMKIIKEEGWAVLYRGWFITFLGKIYS